LTAEQKALALRGGWIAMRLSHGRRPI
jgi:hypothetical protein